MFEIWTLKNYQEAGKPAPSVGNFVALGGRGQNNWLEFGPREIRFIQSIQDNAKLWNWASNAPSGKVYLKINFLAYKWPILLMSSADVSRPRNQVEVLEYKTANGQKWFRARGIPKLNDYSDLRPELEPYLFGMAYTIFPNGTYGLTKQGMLFQMPIFDPEGGFRTSKGVSPLWFPASLLRERLQ